MHSYQRGLAHLSPENAERMRAEKQAEGTAAKEETADAVRQYKADKIEAFPDNEPKSPCPYKEPAPLKEQSSCVDPHSPLLQTPQVQTQSQAISCAGERLVRAHAEHVSIRPEKQIYEGEGGLETCSWREICDSRKAQQQCFQARKKRARTVIRHASPSSSEDEVLSCWGSRGRARSGVRGKPIVMQSS